MQFLIQIMTLEIALIILFQGTGSFYHRITTNWNDYLLILFAFTLVNFIVKKVMISFIKESVKEKYPRRQLSYSLRTFLALISTILLILGIIEVIFNVLTGPFLYCAIITICFPFATYLLLLSLSDPINDKLSWRNLKKTRL
jgi:hypothetical protein